MIRKYHIHKLQTNPWRCQEEPHNNHETPGRQTKQSNQLSLSPVWTMWHMWCFIHTNAKATYKQIFGLISIPPTCMDKLGMQVSAVFLTLTMINPNKSLFWKHCRSRSAGFWEASWSWSTLFYILLVNTCLKLESC